MNAPHQTVRTGNTARDNKTGGFSLIELLVVVAILAILAAVAIPLFLNQKQKARTAQLRTDIHNLTVEMRTQYEGKIGAGGTIDTGATLQTALSNFKGTPGTVFFIYPNCTVETSATSVSMGDFVLRANPFVSGVGSDLTNVLLYDSKTNTWFENDPTRYNNMQTVCNTAGGQTRGQLTY